MEVKPSLNINGLVVKFKDPEEHAEYVRFEADATYQEFQDYAKSMHKLARQLNKRRLDLARQRAHAKWVKEKAK